ncbi:TonB-dependent receptor [uncultured Algibacter sp.]|uniref:TonB-dependent receptor n=1 Tax=uncultured Algibacter sp. TaxID=298659 RepID=UPI00260A9C3B|nr:TonB-dependent receptor [uncultured Algibacter sp.]
MRKHIKIFVVIITLFGLSKGFSQDKKNDTLTTGVIDVVKPYTPTISDAFKVKEVPNIEDETTETKKEIDYNIFSFPVASTFTPAKGKAAVVEKKSPVKLYDNYASLGLGTYNTILGEVYLNHALNRYENIGGYVSHHSSGGGIDEVVLDDDFINSKLEVNYTSKQRDLTWNIDGGVQFQHYNWYGISDIFKEDSDLINSLDVGHSYFDAYVGGELTFEDTYINSGSVFFRHFSDNQGSGENRFIARAKVDVPINDIEISTGFKIDYLGGGFDRNYFSSSELNYSNFQIGLSPTFQLREDDLTVNVGVSLFYLNDIEFGKSKFFIYPNVSATYRVVDDVLIAYGGVTGGLIQNSYHGFANENPFVSPTLFITPTDQVYNVFVGLKGKVSSTMSYNVSGSYIADKNKALFKSNIIKNITAENTYEYGNSFGITYDDIETFGISGELKVDVNRNFKLGLKGEYFVYETDGEAEAWNLPDMNASVFFDYQIDKHWFTGANLFFVGERKDQVALEETLVPADLMRTVTLDSFFDVNAHVGYHINDEFSFFAKVNNIANQQYQKWVNYPVQGIQFLAGATYKFDF